MLWYNYICIYIYEGDIFMTKREELDLFLLRADEFIEGKYILADVKIINLLKAIASSETLLAIFKNCLDGFSFEEAKKKYLLSSKVQSENRGEFILPTNTGELLALIFNLLVKIDAKEIDFSDFVTRYFFEDGSFSSSYQAFVNATIKPFKLAVKEVMEKVIDGKIQDPIEAYSEAELKREKEREEAQIKLEKDRELSKKESGENIKKIKDILLEDKAKVKEKNYPIEKAEELILVIDMLANVIESEDKDAINYAFVAYKYTVRAFGIAFMGREKKISKLLEGILSEL